ncbi:hypothetical protein [Maribacter sp. 2304DJ31-5]|uniref:hypothetical protein n=1 Tax=Maribacter sp. 2304DJ31-5 TaxID=3386273 RepID=UPI0039BCAD2B
MEVVQLPNIDRVVELEQMIKLYTKEIEEARSELFQIKNKEKLAYIKEHLGQWFWNRDSYMKPLKVKGEDVLVLSVGRYHGNPYIEFENIALQNLNLEKNVEEVLPKDIEDILKIVLKTAKQGYSVENKIIGQCKV